MASSSHFAYVIKSTSFKSRDNFPQLKMFNIPITKADYLERFAKTLRSPSRDAKPRTQHTESLHHSWRRYMMRRRDETSRCINYEGTFFASLFFSRSRGRDTTCGNDPCNFASDLRATGASATAKGWGGLALSTQPESRWFICARGAQWREKITRSVGRASSD